MNFKQTNDIAVNKNHQIVTIFNSVSKSIDDHIALSPKKKIKSIFIRNYKGRLYEVRIYMLFFWL